MQLYTLYIAKTDLFMKWGLRSFFNPVHFFYYLFALLFIMIYWVDDKSSVGKVLIVYFLKQNSEVK